MNNIDLKGRTAIVTGGAQGIGLAITKRMIASGARVHIWDRDEKLLARTVGSLNGKATGDRVDVSDWNAVQAAAAEATKKLRKIDILVNNAGIAGPAMPVVDYPVEEWHRVQRINLDGPFFCCKAIVPAMIARKYGRIINISSVAGKEGNPNAAPYSASKAGLIGFTKSLGKELAQTGITVNAVTPSPARTAILKQITEQQVQYMLAKTPMARFVKVQEIAALVSWLASSECTYSTGATFDLSGGRTTY
jgi:2-dehydro-3-deoxy-L-rhamnonate dehydrogenase (NAD+)